MLTGLALIAATAPSGGTFGVQFQLGATGAAAQPRDSCYREARVVTGVAPDASAIPNSGIRTQASVAIEVVIGPDGKVMETHCAIVRLPSIR